MNIYNNTLLFYKNKIEPMNSPIYEEEKQGCVVIKYQNKFASKTGYEYNN